jgi:hypothetical protein
MWQSAAPRLQTTERIGMDGTGSIGRAGEAFIREEARCLICYCVCWRTVTGYRV